MFVLFRTLYKVRFIFIYSRLQDLQRPSSSEKTRIGTSLHTSLSVQKVQSNRKENKKAKKHQDEYLKTIASRQKKRDRGGKSDNSQEKQCTNAETSVRYSGTSVQIHLQVFYYGKYSYGNKFHSSMVRGNNENFKVLVLTKKRVK